MPRRYACLCLAVAGLVLLQAGCGNHGRASDAKYSESRFVMGTIVRLDVCYDRANSKNIQSAYNSVWERFEEIAWRMDTHNDQSDVYKLNMSYLEAVEVGADTYRVIKRSMELSKSTSGAFDITVRPLINLWKESEKRNILPTEKQIDYARRSVGAGRIEFLENNTIAFRDYQTKIDLGGIAKGYAADEAARIFRENGIERFFIDAGGDIYAGGMNCENAPWRIGIRDPRNKKRIIDVVDVIDKAVVTSGDYERYFELGGDRWSHIIDPRTGYPQKEVVSATVIASSAMDADAVATALCVLGAKEAVEMSNHSGGVYASMLIEKTGSGGLQKYESQEFKKYRHKK